MSNYDPKLVGAVTDRGLYRAENEDALWQPDHTIPVQLGALYIVADGVGGQEHGGIAARMAVAVLSDAFYRAREQGQEIPQALKTGIVEANQAVFDEAQLSGLRMGATVVTAVHDAGLLYVAHVGDSRAYLVTGQKLKPLTRDDSLVQKQLDAGIITQAEAAQHQFRNMVTQVLGNKLEIEIHLAEPQPFNEGDFLLLCSDGLSGVVEPETIYDIIEKNTPSSVSGKLVQAAKDAGSQDNITAVVVQQSANQMPFVPVPTVDEKPKKERSFWLWVGMVLFLMAVTALLWWWRGQDGSEMVETTPEAVSLPVVDVESPTPELLFATDKGEMNVSDAITTSSPVTTPLPQVTETAVPTATPSPEPTAIPAPVGCADLNSLAVYVWAKEDLTLENCAAAVASVSLAAGDPVSILEPTPESLIGPQFCTEIDFIEVQSQADDTIVGWVLDTQILRGEDCP